METNTVFFIPGLLPKWKDALANVSSSRSDSVGWPRNDAIGWVRLCVRSSCRELKVCYS